ncbi:TD and POZ domain-containing protein 3 [Nephila pilipes]|uniref:TD and POZ domain-containing protein 3 n=1 Tax=Nephila pilipes TaxID=299642 RepID=A0A8X6QI25_NEPPI|nr:TD and POZ domain-containing protein 3 [Nephila pilipes]
MVVYPRGDRQINEIAFGLKRSEDDSHVKEIVVFFELAFLSANGSILCSLRTARDTFIKFNIKRSECFEKQENVYVIRKAEYLPLNTLTAQCKIWRCDGKAPVDEYFLAQTCVAIEQRSFSWQIEEFSTIGADLKKELLIKSIKNKTLMSFDLNLTDRKSYYTTVDVKVQIFDPTAKYLSFKLFILDEDGKFKNCGEKEFLFDNSEKKGTLSLLISKEELMLYKEKYWMNGVLTLYCECIVSTGIVSETTEKIDYGNASLNTPITVVPNLGGISTNDVQNVDGILTNNAVSLREDLGSLCISDVLSDMKLQTNSNTIPVHTQILGARSPVFRAMFTNDMKEKIEGYVDVPDLDDDTVRRMLLYMYTDKLEDLEWGKASQLYAAADKYEIASLKSSCYAILKAKLRPTNACQILALADLHQDQLLKKTVQDYILAQGKTIFSSAEWKLLMKTNLQLAADIMYQNFNKD